MNTIAVTSELQKVREVAESYRRRGYQVHIQPTRQEVPDFLNGYRPDLIAESANDSVVVEIKSTGGTKPVTWQWLARTVKAQPNWRLDLIVTDPMNSVSGDPRLSEAEIEKRLNESNHFVKSGILDAALLVSWTALEAALRRLCDKYELDLPDEATGTVITRLYTDSLMEREDYDALMRGLTQRNAVVHGYKPSVRPEDISILHDITGRVLAE